MVVPTPVTMGGMWAPRWMSRFAVVAVLLATVLALLLVPASPAAAHAVLVSSSPGANAVLPDPPVEVVLTFSESVREVPDRVRVIGPDGRRVDKGDPVFDGRVVTIPVKPGPEGTYLVSYRVISADSHPVSGGYTYSVGAPSTPPTDSGDLDESGLLAANALKMVKYLGYVGLVLLVGPAFVFSLFWPHRLSRRGPARLAWVGLGLVVVATLAGLWLQAPYTSGGDLFTVDTTAIGDVLRSGYGVAHLVRLGILAAAFFLLRLVLAGRSATGHQVLLAVLGAAAMFTWPLAGHAAASPVPAISVVADAVHLGSMALWLGGLTMLVAFLLRRADGRELAAILPVWSRWAALAVGGLLLAGTAQAAIEVGTFDALGTTAYGRLIITKVVLFAAVLAVAAYSRHLVHNRLASAPARRMRYAVGIELAVAAVILGLSATLVQTTPARTAAATAGVGSADYFSTTLTSSLYSLQVEVDPASTGSNSVHLYAYTPDNRPLPVVEWKATLALPEQGVEPIEIPLLKFTDNHVVGEINLPTPGDWELRVTARTSDIDQATVTATVPIS